MTPRPEPRPAPQWVAPGVPSFAVVGKVNMGKSAVLATLLEEDDDRIIRISPEPGETTRCQRLSLVLDGAERLRFIDTPGFQQPIEALRAIRALADDPNRGPGPEALDRFVERYGEGGAFVDECRLLAPLVEGAGVLYVVDPSVALHDSFIAEIEILRLARGPRLALLNRHDGPDTPQDEARFEAWREQLSLAFNLVRSFNAHTGRFALRRELLAALNRIDERDHRHLDATLALLDAEWIGRRERAAERIQQCLRDAFALREYGHYAETGAEPAQARREAVIDATRRYYQRLSELERAAADDLLDIYRHRAIRAAAGYDRLGDLDLASDETWRRLGLTRKQLTFLGATVGAGAGLTVDAGALGHTLGLATVFGGLSGGALAWFKGEALPTLSMDIAGVSALGKRRVTLGPPRNANFSWILLDSLLIRYRRIVSRAHARRGDGALAGAGSEREDAIVHRLNGASQKMLARWFRDISRGRRDADRDAEALLVITHVLEDIESSGNTN